jgi:hypothetical protein
LSWGGDVFQNLDYRDLFCGLPQIQIWLKVNFVQMTDDTNPIPIHVNLSDKQETSASQIFPSL